MFCAIRRVGWVLAGLVGWGLSSYPLLALAQTAAEYHALRELYPQMLIKQAEALIIKKAQ